MDYKEVMTGLYYLMIFADNNINEKEKASVRQMVRAESINEADFYVKIKLMGLRSRASIFSECMQAIKKLPHLQQVRVVAWLCVVANADGFMERSEWQFIYRVYHKELGLPLNEVFNVQKELNKLIWEQPTMPIL